MSVNCNDCRKEVRFVDTRKEGVVKCDPLLRKVYMSSGRIVEGYLPHECEAKTSGEVPKKQNEKGRLWVGPDNNK